MFEEALLLAKDSGVDLKKWHLAKHFSLKIDTNRSLGSVNPHSTSQAVPLASSCIVIRGSVCSPGIRTYITCAGFKVGMAKPSSSNFNVFECPAS